MGPAYPTRRATWSAPGIRPLILLLIGRAQKQERRLGGPRGRRSESVLPATVGGRYQACGVRILEVV